MTYTEFTEILAIIILSQLLRSVLNSIEKYLFEFDYMNMVILEEEAKTPGTDLYNLINNFGKLTFD